MSPQLTSMVEAYSKLAVVIVDDIPIDRTGRDVHVVSVVIGHDNSLDAATTEALPDLPKGTICVIISKTILASLTVTELVTIIFPEIAMIVSDNFDDYITIWTDPDCTPRTISDYMHPHVANCISVVGKPMLYNAIMVAHNAVADPEDMLTLDAVTAGFEIPFSEIESPDELVATENMAKLCGALRKRILHLNQ